jgi:O-antigen/teichoic acid export membrane protein
MMTAHRRGPSLLRNTVAQSAPLMVGYIFSFVSAPVVIAGLGLRQFGIWALTGALAQYVALLDLGVGASLSRFIAKHHHDKRVCGEYIGLGTLSVTGVSLALIGAALIAAGPLSRALHGISVGDMRVVLLSSALLLFAALLRNVVVAYPVGLRRMVAPNTALVVGATINFVASVGSIAFGAGLPGYALANAAAGAVAVLVVIVFVLQTEGEIPMAWPARRRVGEFFAYSLKNQVVRLTELVNYQTDKILIALAVGPSAAGAYELANRVAFAARQVGVYPLTALLPTLTADISSAGLEPVQRRYGRLLKITVAAGFPPLILAAAVAPMLLTAWLAHVPPGTPIIVAALSLAYLANVSSGVGYVVAAAAGHPGIAARAAIGTAFANLALTAMLAPIFGLWGVLVGTAVALTGGALVQVTMVHWRFELPARDYRDAVVPTLAICFALAAPIAVASYTADVQGRLPAACFVLVTSVAYIVLVMGWAARKGRLPIRVGRWLSGVPLLGSPLAAKRATNSPHPDACPDRA